MMYLFLVKFLGRIAILVEVLSNLFCSVTAMKILLAFFYIFGTLSPLLCCFLGRIDFSLE